MLCQKAWDLQDLEIIKDFKAIVFDTHPPWTKIAPLPLHFPLSFEQFPTVLRGNHDGSGSGENRVRKREQNVNRNFRKGSNQRKGSAPINIPCFRSGRGGA